MSKAQNRLKHPDIAQFCDQMREVFGEIKIIFPYNREPWDYWWIPSPTVKRKRR